MRGRGVARGVGARGAGGGGHPFSIRNVSCETFVLTPSLACNARLVFRGPASGRGVGRKRPRRRVLASLCAEKSGFWQSSPPISPSRGAAAAVSGGETPGRELSAAGSRGGRVAKSPIFPHIREPEAARPERGRRDGRDAPARRCPAEEAGQMSTSAGAEEGAKARMRALQGGARGAEARISASSS